MALPSRLCTRISEISPHRKERADKTLFIVIPFLSVVTEPVPSQTPIATNRIVIPIRRESGRRCRCHDQTQIPIQKVPPVRLAIFHCHLTRYSFAASRDLGYGEPFELTIHLRRAIVTARDAPERIGPKAELMTIMRAHLPACQPPSTKSVWPVMKSEAGLARKMAAPTRSEGSAKRPSLILLSRR